MPIIQGQVGAPANNSLSDGNTYNLLQGKAAELIVAELHGKYYTQNYRGNVFMASLSTATACVAPATNATPNFIIWNPAGNGRAVSLIRINFAYTSGTPAAHGLGYSFIPFAGSALGTAAPMSAFTTLTVQPAIVGASYTGNVKAGSAATVTGTGLSAAALLRYSNLSTGVLGSASIGYNNLFEDFDGGMIIPPGVAWYPVSSAASVATYLISAVWEEVPWP